MRLLRLNQTYFSPTQASGAAALLVPTPNEGICTRFSPPHVSAHPWEPMGPPPLVIYQPFSIRPQPRMLHGYHNGIVGDNDALLPEDNSNTISQPVAQYLRMHEQHRTLTAHTSSLGRQIDSSPTAKRGLPFALSFPSDADQLTKFQVFLRLHIEAFAASPVDVAVRTRGRIALMFLPTIGSGEQCTFPHRPMDFIKRHKTCARRTCNADSVRKCPSPSRRCLRSCSPPRRRLPPRRVVESIGRIALDKWAWSIPSWESFSLINKHNFADDWCTVQPTSFWLVQLDSRERTRIWIREQVVKYGCHLVPLCVTVALD
jgi:hypothetical protein